LRWGGTGVGVMRLVGVEKEEEVLILIAIQPLRGRAPDAHRRILAQNSARSFIVGVKPLGEAIDAADESSIGEGRGHKTPGPQHLSQRDQAGIHSVFLIVDLVADAVERGQDGDVGRERPREDA